MTVQAINAEYLGMQPSFKKDKGIGAAILTFRLENRWIYFNVQLERHALERLVEDIQSVLKNSKCLNTEKTKEHCAKNKVDVPDEVLRKFGLDDYEYCGI